MSDPIAVMNAIDADAVRLDELEQLADSITKTLDEAEENWLEVYDQVAEDLKDEMLKQGRKGDPAEHWIEATARRQNRLAYSNYRRAKRGMEKLQTQMKAKTAAMSGRQSELKVLEREARTVGYTPSPTGETFGSRWRAA